MACSKPVPVPLLPRAHLARYGPLALSQNISQQDAYQISWLASFVPSPPLPPPPACLSASQTCFFLHDTYLRFAWLEACALTTHACPVRVFGLYILA
jgi:hypothetical protein